MLLSKGSVKLLEDAPQQMKILETLAEASESPLTKEPEESLASSVVVVKPDLSPVTKEEPVKQGNLVESKETESNTAATTDVATTKAPMTATDSSAAAGMDSPKLGAGGVVRRTGASSEKKKARRIRTNSQVETII